MIDKWGRLRGCKFAYTTRRLAEAQLGELIEDQAPRAGDVVLARVEEIGQHKRLELRDGRRATLFPGDEDRADRTSGYGLWQAGQPSGLRDCPTPRHSETSPHAGSRG